MSSAHSDAMTFVPRASLAPSSMVKSFIPANLSDDDASIADRMCALAMQAMLKSFILNDGTFYDMVKMRAFLKSKKTESAVSAVKAVLCEIAPEPAPVVQPVVQPVPEPALEPAPEPAPALASEEWGTMCDEAACLDMCANHCASQHALCNVCGLQRFPVSEDADLGTPRTRCRTCIDRDIARYNQCTTPDCNGYSITTYAALRTHGARYVEPKFCAACKTDVSENCATCKESFIIPFGKLKQISKTGQKPNCLDCFQKILNDTELKSVMCGYCNAETSVNNHLLLQANFVPLCTDCLNAPPLPNKCQTCNKEFMTRLALVRLKKQYGSTAVMPKSCSKVCADKRKATFAVATSATPCGGAGGPGNPPSESAILKTYPCGFRECGNTVTVTQASWEKIKAASAKNNSKPVQPTCCSKACKAELKKCK